jgi:hypothetical protein
MFGSRRFDTIDDSRNNALTAFFAAGEGWHNNHHRFQRAARNGFFWWEFDPTWYVITLMAAVGLAWDVQAVPARIYAEARARKAGERMMDRGSSPGSVDAVTPSNAVSIVDADAERIASGGRHPGRDGALLGLLEESGRSARA